MISELNPEIVAFERLVNQQIIDSNFRSEKDLVAWMGVMQAQDFKWANWALGARLPFRTGEKIESAFAKGKIIRTHLLRPTWHFVSPDDIYWMLELSAPHIKISMRSREKELEIDDSLVKKCNKILEGLLKENNHLTREEIAAVLKGRGISMDGSRAAHIMARAELDGIVCSGRPVNGKQTYALLQERVPRKKILNREEALAELAERYFISHGPASLQDFTWWSGLPAAEAKKGLEDVKIKFISQPLNGVTYWFKNFNSAKKYPGDSLFLLPPYDEFLISYKNRSPSVPLEIVPKKVSSSGIFRPIIVLNGITIGLWSVKKEKENVLIETDLFSPPGRRIKYLINKASENFSRFLQKKIELKYLKR